MFQGAFKREVVENAPCFLTVLRYIHQNPIKAGLEQNVIPSKWTSVNEYIPMDKEHRNTVLAKLKMTEGVSLRQLSGIRGISKSVIQRIH